VHKLLAWLRDRADNVAVALLTAMFASFVVQIVSRYVLDAPVGWSVEVCLTTWLWVVFWNAAFCLDDRDHVRFEILHQAASPRVQRIFALISAVAIVVALLAALPATLSYISFYKIKKSATLHLRFDYVFSVYGAFTIAVILRYLWRIASILRGRAPDASDADHEALIEGE
jgi:C4-dicarboxylate transporter, DctQ subunit